MSDIRTGITSVKSLKKILDKLPKDYLISSNRVGNLSIHRWNGKSSDCTIEYIGYIELTNAEFVLGSPKILPKARATLFENIKIE